MNERLSYADLQERVARKLQVIADTESLSAEDGEVIGKALTSLEAMLDKLDILHVTFSEGLNEIYAEPVALMAAALLVDEFQIPEPRHTQLKGEGMLGMPGRSLAERRLRMMVEIPTAKLHVQTDVSAR